MWVIAHMNCCLGWLHLKIGAPSAASSPLAVAVAVCCYLRAAGGTC